MSVGHRATILAAAVAVGVAVVGCKPTNLVPGESDDGSPSDAVADLGVADAVGTDGGLERVGAGGVPGAGGGVGGVGGVGGAGGSLGGAGGIGGAAGGPCVVEAPAGGAVFDGSLTINSAADAAAAQAYTAITGDLAIGATFGGTVDVPRLRTVGGGVFAEGHSVTNLRAPNLTSIGGDLWIYLATSLVELDLRSLVTVGGRLWVYRNPKLATLRLDALREVADDVQIRDDLALGACVVDDIIARVTAGMTKTGLGTMHTGCHCETVCNHAEERCP